MLLVTPIACLLLAWVDPPATPAAPKAPHDVSAVPLYEVMVVNSGAEIVVRHDRGEKPVTVRLLGIDTPKVAPKPEVDRLNQTIFLRGLVKNKDLVSLETEPGAIPEAQGHLVAHVRRATDNLWLNLDMIEQGFATRSNTDVFAAQAEFAAAEQQARAGQHGMWAPDFLANSAQLSTFVRVHHRHRVHPAGVGQIPFGGMVGGNNGMVFVPNRGSGSGSGSNNSQNERDEDDRRRQRENEAARRGSNTYDYGYYPNPVRPLPNYVPRNDFGGGGYANPGGNAGVPGAAHFGGFARPEHSSGSGGGGNSGSGGGSSSGSSGSSGESHSGGSAQGHSGHHGK